MNSQRRPKTLAKSSCGRTRSRAAARMNTQPLEHHQRMGGRQLIYAILRDPRPLVAGERNTNDAPSGPPRCNRPAPSPSPAPYTPPDTGGGGGGYGY